MSKNTKMCTFISGGVSLIATIIMAVKGFYPLWQEGKISSLPMLGVILILVGLIWALVKTTDKTGLGKMIGVTVLLVAGFFFSNIKAGKLIYTTGLMSSGFYEICVATLAIALLVTVCALVADLWHEDEDDEQLALPHAGAVLTTNGDGEQHLLTADEANEIIGDDKDKTVDEAGEDKKPVENESEPEEKEDKKPIESEAEEDSKEEIPAKDKVEDGDKSGKDKIVVKGTIKKDEPVEAESEPEEKSKEDDGITESPNGETVVFPEDNPRVDGNNFDYGDDEEKTEDEPEKEPKEDDKESKSKKGKHIPKH